MIMVEIGHKKTIDGHQAYFKIGNQTFFLQENIEDTKRDSLEVVRFYKKMLKVAFEKIDIKVEVKK